MDTKLKGDIAEQAAVLHALKRGWGVLKPIGDRLPYDLAFDIEGTVIKIQVKYAWFDQPSSNYVVDNRRTKTNRRLMLREAFDTLRRSTAEILGSTSPLKLDPLRYLKKRWFSPQALTSGMPYRSCITKAVRCSGSPELCKLPCKICLS
ncbi:MULTISPECIES: group I intron-associated PD-(D/E)XK endonuclease [unclassified Calothrix]|uniref:group I intron-associated PD-(D/E)XK endonuclease n=1 Tax=unclassified Calothrix TaxID=2619626 RepID=UPI001F54BB99|nr:MULTISPECIES: group I intron-associated PD-(D/E)XK endonuclease [unclassified Calothrix]